LLVLVAACGGGDASTPDAPPDVEVTWHQDIAPLVAEKCGACHLDGGVAFFSIERYEDAVIFADGMAEKTESREMPPWGPTDTEDCEHRFDWRNDRSLSDEQIALIRAWADGGALEGDPETAAPVPALPVFTLDDATHDATPLNPYTTSGFFDELMCFIVDPQITEDLWVTAVQFTPGNAQVVHHTVAAVVPPESAQQLRDLAGPDETYPCFGGLGVAGWPLGGWVPGMFPFEYPDGVGVELPAGSLLVMQIHYHPISQQVEPDLTTIHMRTTSTPPPRRMRYLGFGNVTGPPRLQAGPNDRGQVEFRIPADVADHTETYVADFANASYTLGIDPNRRYSMMGVFPHMHYIGVDVRAHIRRATTGPGEPVEECMLQVPAWNFDWQDRYFFDAEIADLPTIGPGDEVVLRCQYDNTEANPFVRRALLEQGLDEPQDVYLGDGTLDEMCWFGIYVID
jgi:hypothetical protein